MKQFPIIKRSCEQVRLHICWRPVTSARTRQQIGQPPAARWHRATPHLHTACTRCPLLTPVHPRGPHTNTRPATLCLGAHVMTCEVAAEAASRQLHAEHLHPMRSGAGARRTSATASTASLPAILRRLAASHHHWPPLRATASSECQGGELPMDPVDLSCAWDPLKSTS